MSARALAEHSFAAMADTSEISGAALGRPKAHNQRLGELGERIAARWLARKGWRVVYRRFRNGRRDIDLVMQRDATVAFVEVKARKGSEFGDPVEAVHHRKQRELARSAHVWIDRHGRVDELYRFDVVGVLMDGDRVLVKHVENAFSVSR
jgi:putative endonuclease